MYDGERLRTVATKIADGERVDWTAAARTATSDQERELLSRLRAISTVVSADCVNAASERPSCPKGNWILFHMILPIAALKIVLGGFGWVVWPMTGSLELLLPPWPYITNVAVFGIVGAALVLGGHDDRRSRALGGFFVLVASAFSDRLLLGLLTYDSLHVMVMMLRALSMDAFIAFALWSFAWAFPAPPLGTTDQRMTAILAHLSFAVALVLVLANIIVGLAAFGLDLPALADIAGAVARHATAESYYWFVLLGVAVPALPYLLWKSRFEALDKRRRTALFTAALVAGLAPMMLVVIASNFVSFFDDPPRQELVGLFLYVSLLAVAPLTAYAVVVHRVIDVDLLISRTMQHALVRYLLWTVSLTPLAYLLAYVYVHREVSVTEIVAKHGFSVLLAVPLLSLLVLTFRKELLATLDGWLLGAQPDHATVLARLQHGFREAHGVVEVSAMLCEELDRAVHPRVAAVLIADETGRHLVSPTGSVPPLDAESVLGTLLRLSQDEVFAGIDASGPVGRLLPDDDRRWLNALSFQLLMPMAGSTGELLGVVAVAEKRNQAPFSAGDRALLGTMASQAAVVLENRALRDLPFRYLGHGKGTSTRAIDWDEEACTLCSTCHKTWPARRTRCECGGPTAPTAVPLLVRSKFRIERLIGSGGMGLVYLATDISLDRRVAIKTLPRLTPQRALRLEREGRAMAAVALHPNLAMIFGTESWRGLPLLVAEYLEGGTLADRLQQGRLTPRTVVRLGIVLADVLDQIHAADVFHRDIKPTNIGYTRDGVPKLLDFGVASVLRESPSTGRSARTASMSLRSQGTATSLTRSSASLTATGDVVGTPIYLAPEALDGAEPGPSFDLWSVSLVLFEALTGQQPFRAPTAEEVFEKIRSAPLPDIRSLHEACPEPLAILFGEVLARDPERRPASADELRTRLQEVAAVLPSD